jgi:hypothetical protein
VTTNNASISSRGFDNCNTCVTEETCIVADFVNILLSHLNPSPHSSDLRGQTGLAPNLTIRCTFTRLHYERAVTPRQLPDAALFDSSATGARLYTSGRDIKGESKYRGHSAHCDHQGHHHNYTLPSSDAPNVYVQSCDSTIIFSTMSSPPRTPTHRPASSHRRRPSSLEMSESRRQSFNRPGSRSGYSPLTPRSSHEFEHGSPAQRFGGGGDNGGGLGNLADELGEWGSEDEEMDSQFGEELEHTQEVPADIGTAVEHDGSTGVHGLVNLNGVRDSGVALQSSPSTQSRATLSPSAAIKSKKHIRQQSLYDGSDYGDDSDLENEGITPALESRMAAIESLARRGMEENGSASDEVVKRVTEHLRDLGSQIAIENGATRYSPPHLQRIF